MVDKIAELEQRRDTMIAYARMKLDSHDWHGVRDACVDIEILEANLLYLKVRLKDDALTTQLDIRKEDSE